MEKLGEYVKKSVRNFKLERCCFVASVRTGALTLACVNVILGLRVMSSNPFVSSSQLVILVALAEDSFDPILLQALYATTDKEEDAPDFKPSCVVAYAAEIASNALVICAMWRNDIVLLRAYLYYALGVLTGAVMVYSVVFGALELIPELLIVASVCTQLYQIMLVRSAMVEIKEQSIKNGYTVNLKANPESSSTEKFTVSIDPEKPKIGPKPIVRTVTKEDISKPVVKETKEAAVTVHSPAKEAFLRDESEVAKPSRFRKELVKIGDKASLEKIEVAKKIAYDA